MKGQIRVVVERDGKVTLSTEGVNGPRCLNLTEFLERGLGEVVKRQRTRDFYKEIRLTQRNQIHQKNLSR
jgi:hypothetical protein